MPREHCRDNVCSCGLQVCGVLDIPVDEDVLRASDKQAGGAAAEGEAGPGSAMEEDASDDVSDD
jgi:hypothetical protein